MLKVYLGNDTTAVRSHALAESQLSKDSGMDMEVIDDNSYETGAVIAAAGSPGLFGVTNTYLIDTPIIDTPFYEETLAALSAMAESASIFIVILPALLAAEKKRFVKHAAVLEEYKAAAKERPNNFAMADALANKDKRSLWLLFSEARLRGAAPEELSGIIWWQLKTLRLASLTGSAAAAGLKDYPYKKAKRALVKFQPGELSLLSRSLLIVLHESRLGRYDLDQALERWILSL